MLTNGKDYIERRIEHGLKDIGYVESLYPEYFWEDHHRRVFVEYVVKNIGSNKQLRKRARKLKRFV